jgi:hypothetical protein
LLLSVSINDLNARFHSNFSFDKARADEALRRTDSLLREDVDPSGSDAT